MSLLSRIRNAFRKDAVSRDIDEELADHIDNAISAGRTREQAIQALGHPIRHRESSMDLKLVASLDSIRADTVFAIRQFRKNKLASAVSILSLALAIGALTAAFRLTDALLFRPLPIAAPERLYALLRQGFDANGQPRAGESYEYPGFERMREAVKDQATLIASSYSERIDITYQSDAEMEKAQRQFVSGSMFPAFGLRPAIGRLFTEADDQKPGAHPYAVLSHNYWTSRFGADPTVVGRTVRLGNDLYSIIGVVSEGFTGTEPGTSIDIFLTCMMHPAVTRSDSSWFRTFALLKPGIDPAPVVDRLSAPFRSFLEERARGFVDMPKARLAIFLNETVSLEPAGSGSSGLKRDYQQPLAALGILVVLLLLIACANVANLMTAQAASRAREMALRVSIGAGRGRLMQLVLVESASIALAATALGMLFAAWAAPFVAGMINPPDNPVRLSLPFDWRTLAFSLAAGLCVTVLFGLTPAIRASGVKPVAALKGGDDAHRRPRLMNALIAVQVAFCFLILFTTGLFVATFDRLSTQSTGFSAERLLVLDTVTRSPVPLSDWNQVAEHLRTVPGVEAVAMSGWTLLSGNGRNGYVSTKGQDPTPALAYFLGVSPGWIEIMKIPLLDGRDLNANDTEPGSALVNQAFADLYFKGDNPVGQYFEKPGGPGPRTRFQIAGLVADARYRNMREPITPTAYVSLRSLKSTGEERGASRQAILVRTELANPLTLAQTLRREVASARTGFRVTNLRAQTDINAAHTVRERLLALLASFFALVALLLAAIGLYGVLDYSVYRRRREIGIRLALGATNTNITRHVTVDACAMIATGLLLGLGIGWASARFLSALVYQVRPTELSLLAAPAAILFAAALLAALPPVFRALRIDPAVMLRPE